MMKHGFPALFLTVTLAASACATPASLLDRLQLLPAAPPGCPADVALPQPLPPGQGGAGAEAPLLWASGPGFTARVDQLVGDDRWTCSGCAVAWTPDASAIVTVGRGAALLWDPDTGRATREIAPLPDIGGVGEVALSPDGRWIAYAAAPRPAALHEPRLIILASLESEVATSLGEWRGGELFFSPDSGTLIAGHAIFDVAAAAPIWRGSAPSDPEGHRCAERPELIPREDGMAWRPAPPCPELRWLASGRVALEVQAVDVDQADGAARPNAFAVALVARDGREVVRLALLPASPERPFPPRPFLDPTRRRAAVWWDGLLQIWSLPDGQRLASIPLERQPDWVDLAADGSRVLASWNPAGQLVPGGRQLVEAPGRPAVQVWALPSGEPRWEAGPERPEQLVLHGAFSPDGAWIVGRDPAEPTTLRVLDANTGALLAAEPHAPEHTRPTPRAVLVLAPGRFYPLRLPDLAAPPRPPRVVAASFAEAAVIDHHDNLLRLGADGACTLLQAGGASSLRQVQIAPSGRISAFTDAEPPALLLFDTSSASSVPLPAGASARLQRDQLWFEDPDAPGRVQRVDLVASASLDALLLPRLPTGRYPTTRPAILYDLDPAAAFVESPPMALDVSGSAVRVWPLGASRGVVKRVEAPAAITALAAPSDARALLIGTAAGGVLALDPERLQLTPLAGRLPGAVIALTAASGRGGFVVAADAEGAVVFLDRRSGAELARIDLHPRYDRAEHLACDLASRRCAVWTQRGARLEITLEIADLREP